MPSERPNAAQELEDARLRRVAESAHDAIVCADRQGTITSFDAAAERIFGYAAAEAIGRPITLLVPSGLARLFEEAEARATAGRAFVVGRRRDGGELPLEASVACARHAGQVLFVAILRDGGERAAAEAALREGQERYRMLFESSPRPMWVFDQQTLRFLAVNDAAVADYGWTRDELLTMTLADIHVPDEVPAVTERVAAVGTLGGKTSWRHRRKDGTRFDVEIRSHAIAFEGRAARLVIVEDVTQRLRAEQALRESERRFREMLENASLIAIVLDLAGRVTFANDHCARLLGWTKEELLGESWFARCIPEDERAALEGAYLERIAGGRIAAHDQNDVLTRAGDRRRIAWNNTVLRDPEGRVVGTACIGLDVTDELRAKEKLVYDALHDALTGLPNRVLFIDRVNQARARATRREGASFAVLVLNLDRFKVVNDGLGHALGDQLLVAASDVLKRCIGPGDTVARVGGDEFAVLLEDATGADDAQRVARRIHDALEKPLRVGSDDIYTSASIGIAVGNEAYARAEDLLRDAHTAMYGAKAQGASRHAVFKGSMRLRAVRLLQMENDLRRALDRGELAVHYQPIVTLSTGRVDGFEALLRWEHPRRGAVSPLEFIPIAEQTGLILPIGRWVLAEACACIKRWESRARGRFDATVNVNLSGRQFAQADLLGQIDAVLGEAGLDPHRLKLEVTETVLMENADSARATLDALRARGVRMCIDDFGTGYSSLAYLVRLPVDTIKVDRAFVRGMFDREENFEIVRTIVQLAKNLRMDVVAEGVETKEQRARLEALGCDRGQGFLFSEAVDEGAAWGMLEAAGGGGG